MKQRFITGLLIGLIVVPLLLLGNIPYLIGIILLLGGVAYELSNIKKHNWLIKTITILLVTLPTLYNYFNLDGNITNVPILLIFLPIFIYFTIAVWNSKFDFNEATFLSLFTILMILFGKSALYIRNINDNANALAFVLLTTCSVDIFALLSGKFFGKHKLNERISPKKTIEGAIGGTLCALILALIFNLFFPIFSKENTTNLLNLGFNSSLTLIEPLKVLSIAIILTISGQLGDLFFSMIKRHYQIKDFSNLLPGHGGLTDRIDSVCVNFILFSILFAFLITL